MRVGSLCTGIGGLDLAVEAHFGAELVWCAEYEQHLDPIIQRHFGPVLNLGDLTTVSWDELEPVDILTAGYPCQPFSHAGKRKGADDARHLWPYIWRGLRVLQPRYAILENVAGHLSLGFDRVLGDLAEAGFDAEWCLLRASDVGAPHGRARVWIVATDTQAARQGNTGRLLPCRLPTDADAGARDRDASVATDASRQRHGGGEDGRADKAREWQRTWQKLGDRSMAALADPDSQPTGRNAGTAPRPQEPDARWSEPHVSDRPADGAGTRWGVYEAAIRRWERTLGRPAPRPVDDQGRLDPPFVEWMMGYPAGWVDGLTRTQALKALGNAVVPQQALAALNELAPHLSERAA